MANAELIRGTNGRILLGGSGASATPVNLDEYSLEMEGEDLPAVGFEDYNTADNTTYDDGAIGILSATVSASGYWSAALNPHADPPGIKVGLMPLNNQFWVNRLVNNKYYKFAQLRMLRTRTQNRVRGRLEISFTAKSNGRFVYPT